MKNTDKIHVKRSKNTEQEHQEFREEALKFRRENVVSQITGQIHEK